jgi:alpha-beta hydrolase superfamily lysophospholipase
VRPVPAPAGSSGAAIVYWSTTVTGALVAVSGVLFQPASAPAQPRPIVAWAHGTSGLGSQCAPSQAFFAGQGSWMPLVKQTLQLGAVFVATDYQGLGVGGGSPYLVGLSEGRDVLDSIRAAAQYTHAGARPLAVALGESEGGGAALFAAELAPQYAPQLRLRGVAAVAPPSHLAELAADLSGGQNFGYDLMAIAGFQVAYPSLSQDDRLLTAAGRAALARIQDQCETQILKELSGGTEAEFGVAAVLQAPDFAARLVQNDPGHRKTPVPIFIAQGSADTIVSVQASRALVQEYCAAGDSVVGRLYPGATHGDILQFSLSDVIAYLRDRLQGHPVPASWGSSCAQAGHAG